MKSTLRLLALISLVLVTVLCAVACGGETPVTTETTETSTTTEAVTYTVSFENTTLSSQTLERGAQLPKPSDPSKADSIFVGWYTDSAYSNKAEFPITVTSDVKLYARFYTYEEAFVNARKNTVGDNVPGFSYNYTLDISATVGALSLSGNTVGSAIYSTLGEVGYYDKHVNSGALFYDGSKFKIRRGTTLQTIAVDENGKIKSLNIEEVDAGYKYDSSSLAKAVFSYSDEQLKSIKPTSEKGVYELDTAMGTSSVIALIANYINHPIIEKLLIDLPETSANVTLLVTFNGDKIEAYGYDFTVNVSGLQFNLRYVLAITSSGEAKEITPQSFNGVALSASEIKTVSDEAFAIISTFRNKTSSAYDFLTKTGVDFGATEGEINATFQGIAYRKLYNGSVFFHNEIEIDSDYKNADVYKDKGIADVKIKETKLANGEVHLIEKKTLIDSTQKVENFVDSDNTSFYLFDIFQNSGAFSFAEKEEKNGEIIYTFGITNSGAASLFTWLNGSLDLDPLNKATADVTVFGKFDASSILVNTGKVVVTVKNGALKDITLKVEGDLATALEGSAGFSEKKNAQIKLDMTITPNAKGDTFEPFTSVKDAK